MSDDQEIEPAAWLRQCYWQLRALLVLLPWQLRTPVSRQLLPCRPGPGQVAGYLLAALLGSGCTSLPVDVPRVPTQAMAPAAETRLAQVVRASESGEVAVEAEAGLSGFRLLPDGDHALDARLALARRAQQSLDIQYYLIAADDVGGRFLRELSDAAARGVRVRLLVDDLHAGDAAPQLAKLASQSHAEVRLFNPLPARGGTPAARVLLSMHQFDRINRRMHNKLFIADGTLAVTGGRNIADDYFKRGEPSNFIDMDVLSSGPVVRELSALFDWFWNSEQAYPVEALIPDASDGGGAALAQDAQDARGARGAQDAAADLPVTPFDRFGRSPVSAQLDAGRLDQHFASARVLADAPEKASGGMPFTRDGTALEGALQAMRTARSEVLLATPYLIPGPRGLGMIRDALANNVRVVFMTNALAATDEPLVHWGYARYRAQMVRMGVELHELSPTLGRNAVARGESGSSLGRLHAKLAVIDERLLLVGSMNMDARSMRTNTEVGLLIDSPALAGEVARTLQQDRDTSTYRLRAGATPSAVEWVSRDLGREVVHHAEPDAGWALRFRLGLMSMFVAESWL